MHQRGQVSYGTGPESNAHCAGNTSQTHECMFDAEKLSQIAVGFQGHADVRQLHCLTATQCTPLFSGTIAAMPRHSDCMQDMGSNEDADGSYSYLVIGCVNGAVDRQLQQPEDEAE
jgi:hypothetical protein